MSAFRVTASAPRAAVRTHASKRARASSSSSSSSSVGLRRRSTLASLGAALLVFARSSDAATYGTRARASLGDGMNEYPGTALERTANGRARAASLSEETLSGDWDATVRPKLLWAAGLKDLTNVPPGKGNTGHCFNDFNHVDATTMILEHADNKNQGRVAGMAYDNPLGEGIRAARDDTMGEGGSWCTCILGSAQEPPADVAHVQFQSRVAWKLVWVPGAGGDDFSRFVLVDDAGVELATGVPSGNVPTKRERRANYQTVAGGRYATAADARSS